MRGDGRSPILERRKRLADDEARMFLGTLYSVLALHIEPKALKQAAHWRGVVDSLSIAFRRYANGEATALLRRAPSVRRGGSDG